MWESEASRERFWAWYLSTDYINGGNPHDDGEPVRRKSYKKRLAEAKAKNAPELRTSKKCKYCGVEKPLVEFVKNDSMRDGYLNMCRTCYSVYRKSHKGRVKPTYTIVPSPM